MKALLFCGCFGVIMLFSLIGCSPPAAPSNMATSKPASAPVAIVQPQRKSIKRVIEQPGMVQAYEETQLFARVPGYVRLPLDAQGRILVDIGHKVRGPVLGPMGKEIEPGEILADLMVPELEE